jgi:hypothetical protein
MESLAALASAEALALLVYNFLKAMQQFRDGLSELEQG